MEPVIVNVLGTLAGVIAGLILAGAARRQRPSELPVPVKADEKPRRRRKA
jgi:hypothetical protein